MKRYLSCLSILFIFSYVLASEESIEARFLRMPSELMCTYFFIADYDLLKKLVDEVCTERIQLFKPMKELNEVCNGQLISKPSKRYRLRSSLVIALPLVLASKKLLICLTADINQMF